MGGTASTHARSGGRARLTDLSDRLAEIVRTTPEAVCLSDATGHVMWLNDAARALLGFAPDDDVDGLPLSELYAPHVVRALADVAVPILIETGAWSGKSTVRRKDATEIEIDQVSLAHRDRGGRIRWFSTQMRVAEKAAANIYEALPIGVIVFAPDQSVLAANVAASKILGVKVDDLRRTGGDEPWRVRREDGTYYAAGEWPVALALSSGHPVHNQVMGIRRPDGEQRWLLVSAAPISGEGDDGRPIEAVASLVDVTEERRMRSALADATAQMELQSVALDQAANTVVILDAQAAILYANLAFEETTGWAVPDAIGRRLWDLIRSDVHQPDFYSQIWDGLRKGDAWNGEMVSRRRDGTLYPDAQTLTPILGESNQLTHVVAIGADASRWREQEARLGFLADHDALTGLLNRTALRQMLGAAVDAALGGRRGALIYVDVDRFTALNDGHGHGVGDSMLRALAHTLASFAESSTRSSAARLGGDEFGVLIGEFTPAQAVAAAERLRDSLARVDVRSSGRAVRCEVSVGVAIIDGTAGPDELLSRADVACYAAKARGGNRVVVHTTDLAEQLTLVSDERIGSVVRAALANDQFRFAYQPIVRLSDMAITHYEALVRLHTAEGEVWMPDAFIPAAERLGLVAAIDRWAVHQAVHTIATESSNGRSARLAVNLSSLSLREGDIAGTVEREIRRANIDARHLTFEITETAAITNMVQATVVVERLRSMGCSFALDDFGIGFSSFAYLRHLPVDMVKIDGSFIRSLATDPINRVLVKSMNETAHALGMATVAERVEDANAVVALQDLGIDYGQGYHLGRPAERPFQNGRPPAPSG